jgi:hypothetical protein
MFVIYFHNKFNVPCSSGSFVITKKMKANEKFVWLPFYFIFLKSFTFTKLNTFTYLLHISAVPRSTVIFQTIRQFFPGRYWHLMVWRCFNTTFQATDLWALAVGLTLLITRLVFGGRQILIVPYISCI